MDNRQLHPREEPYRWAIDKLDEAFGRDQVRVTPRNHYHVIRVTVTTAAGRADLVLREPTHDLNREENRDAFLATWIANARKVLVPRKHAA